jgi:septal ring-binding cell division protein DamX
VVEKEAPVHQDPFTIQVAAYLKSEDARRFVDQLTAKGLEAFWTTAASADRTWYQVKVSHFATKEAARSFGLDLKSKGLIDDFYVANYSGAPPPQPSPGQ